MLEMAISVYVVTDFATYRSSLKRKQKCHHVVQILCLVNFTLESFATKMYHQDFIYVDRTKRICYSAGSCKPGSNKSGGRTKLRNRAAMV